MLAHLELSNSVELLSGRDVAVVHAEDASAGRVAAVVGDAGVTEAGLVLAEGDTGDFAAVVLVREGGEGAPATADVEKVVVRLEVELVDMLA